MKLDDLGMMIHGDVNRYNFLITEGSAKLIGFELAFS